MADVDKSLPNVEQTVVIEPQKEVVQEEIVEQKGPVEITPLDDGGAEVTFDPRAVNQPGTDKHFDNLSELLPDHVLDRLGSELFNSYQEYRFSRKEWEDSYTKGLDLLGFKYETRTEPFRGASGATHPVLAEAVTQFQALAYKELFPAGGPVRTQILGLTNIQRQQQAHRVKDFMNYQLTSVMKEYEPEFDQMLFYLPLIGSTFKKIYYDQLLGRAVSKFVPADDLIVPYTATSLQDAEAIMHVLKVSKNDLRKQQVGGFYRDIELAPPSDSIDDRVTEKEREIEGIKKSRTEDVYTLIECHVNLDLEGFEDMDQQGEPTEIKLPYIVTVEEASRKILSIRRNYNFDDPLKKKVQYFVHFKFLPGLGFYGFGLIHMIGGLSRTATVALRSLLDAATLSNLPAGFKMRGVRIRDDASPLQPGEFRDIDAPAGNIREAFTTLPYKEPSQTLLALMGVVVQAGQRFASIADLQVGDGNQQAAVGTTVALLERGSRTMSAIHKRLYAGLRDEYVLLAKVFSTYLPPEYPYDVVGGNRMIKVQDFDDRVDILPIADPNIFSQSQRIMLAQTELQLATSNPQIHDLYMSYRKMYEALGVHEIDRILPPPPPQVPKDPAIEHIDALGGKKFQAYRGQNHRAHLMAHLDFMATNLARNNPMVMAAVEKNIFEHISLMAQEQVEIEFADQLKQLQMMGQNLQMPQQAQLLQDLESRKAELIAEMMEEFMKEEKSITSQFDNDPIAKLRARELDLRAMENQRKERYDESRTALDRSKLLQNKDISEDKLEQNEDLAELRAETSMAKSMLSAETKLKSDRMKRQDVRTLKGPRR